MSHSLLVDVEVSIYLEVEERRAWNFPTRWRLPSATIWASSKRMQ